MSTRIIFLESTRLYLRPYCVDDVPHLLRMFNHKDVRTYLGREKPLTYEEEREYVENQHKRNNTNVEFIIVLKGNSPGDDQIIGTMGLHRISHLHQTAVTGAFIESENHRSKGFGAEAKHLVLDYAFNVLNLRAVESRVLGFNERSYRYNIKCGYKEIGRLPNWRFRPHPETGVGVYTDEIIMVVTRENFLRADKKK